MNYFADTSFFCSLYRTDSHSRKVDTFCESHPNQIVLSSLISFEFRQSIRLQIYQYVHNKNIGISKEVGINVLHHFQTDTQTSVFKLLMPDWAEVHTLAEIISAKYTESKGHRFADILHVATALQLACHGFLTFDSTQKKLAIAEGLNVPV